MAIATCSASGEDIKQILLIGKGRALRQDKVAIHATSTLR